MLFWGRDYIFNRRQTSRPTPVHDDLSKVLLNAIDIVVIKVVDTRLERHDDFASIMLTNELNFPVLIVK